MAGTNEQSRAAAAAGGDLGRLVLRAYREMLNYLFLSTSSIVGLLILLIFFPGVISFLFHQDAPPISIFLLVVMAGTLGAFFSALLRFYEMKNLPTILYQDGLLFRGSSLFIYTLTPALVGGIAAAILYLIFQAHLLQGTPFPAIDCVAADKCSSLGALLGNYGPKEPADFAKAILWGFIAGFAERLVPDLLENFAQTDALKSAAPKDDQGSTVDDGKAQTQLRVAGPEENPSPKPPDADAIGPQIASRGAANAL
jgi:hypothetical protein